MAIHWADYSIVCAYLLFAVLVGVFMREKKGEGTMRSFFLSKQNMPWWLLGASMVATTFSAGTPGFIAGWVHKHGIAKLWEWYPFLIGGMLTAFFWLGPARDLKELFFLYTALGAGSGLVFIARFYWWRVSAWSEVAAMATSFAMFVLFRWVVYDSPGEFNAHALHVMMIGTAVVTAVWVAVSLVHRPNEDAMEHLKTFYRQVHPSLGWAPIARAVAEEDGKPTETDAVRPMLVGWIASTICVYAGIIGFGKLALLAFGQAAAWLAVFAATLCITVWAIRRMIAEPAAGGKA